MCMEKMPFALGQGGGGPTDFKARQAIFTIALILNFSSAGKISLES